MPLSSIVTSAAVVGTNASATAGAWRGGVARKAWAVISRPTKIEDRGHRGLRHQADEDRDDASHRPEADQEPGRQRVPCPRAHRLVGGMAHVRGVLDHAPAHAREDRGEGLGQQDVPRAVAVARRRWRSRCCRCRR